MFSTKKEHYSGHIIEVSDQNGRARFVEKDIIPGDESTDSKWLIYLDTTDFEELVDYIADKYGKWKAKHVGSV